MSKNKKQEEKPRKFIITGDFTATTSNMTFSLQNGQLIATDDNRNSVPIQNLEVKRAYSRENKSDKILNLIPTGINSNDINKVLSEYDFIYGVDTNTKYIQNKYISIGVIVKGVFIEKKINGFNLKYGTFKAIESTAPNKFWKIEQLYWSKAIELIKNDLLPYMNPKIALVVDCNLQNLQKYNKREIPLYDTVYLPSNFTLIYASSDSGNECLVNKIIRECDRVSNNEFKLKYYTK